MGIANPFGRKMNSPLHVMSNYATFTTREPVLGCTTDLSNPCIALNVTKLGLIHGHEVLMSDRWMVREVYRKDAEPSYMQYDPDTRTTIEAYARRLFEESSAKVVMLQGKANFDWFRREYPDARWSPTL